jgi:uncharacterized C2H2 Zn-finger protein
MTGSNRSPVPGGTQGPWERRLRCPHCQQVFDYAFVPGASVTAVRLGTSRYMRCPLCDRFALFSLRAPGADGDGSTSAPPRAHAVPRFSDRRTMASWTVALLAPALALILLGGIVVETHPIGWGLILGGLVLLGVGTVLLLAFGRPHHTR